MKNIICYLLSIFFITSFVGCSNKQTNYLKDGESILYAKNIGNERIYFAIELFNKELKIHPNSARAQADIAIAYGNLGQHDHSIQLITNYIEQRRKDLAEFYHLRGMQKFIKNDLGNAIEDFRMAIQIDTSKKNIYGDIVFSKLWQKYHKNGKWMKFDKRDIASLISEVYPKDSHVPTVNELIRSY